MGLVVYLVDPRMGQQSEEKITIYGLEMRRVCVLRSWWIYELAINNDHMKFHLQSGLVITFSIDIAFCPNNGQSYVRLNDKRNWYESICISISLVL